MKTVCFFLGLWDLQSYQEEGSTLTLGLVSMIGKGYNSSYPESVEKMRSRSQIVLAGAYSNTLFKFLDMRIADTTCHTLSKIQDHPNPSHDHSVENFNTCRVEGFEHFCIPNQLRKHVAENRVRASYGRENMKVMWVEAHQEYALCLIFGSQPQALDPASGKGLSKTGVL